VSRATRAGSVSSTARIVATFPTRGDANLRSIDCPWDTNKGPARVTITDKGLHIEIDLHGVDPALFRLDEAELQENDPRRRAAKTAHDGVAV
jgi:hypothetical protein